MAKRKISEYFQVENIPGIVETILLFINEVWRVKLDVAMEKNAKHYIQKQSKISQCKTKISGTGK